MSTYDVLGRVIVNDTSTEAATIRREDLEVAFTEKVVHTYVVPASSTDLALSLGGLSNADLLWLECETPSETWSFKIGGTGNTAITMTGQAFVVLKGATVTSIHVTATNSVTLKLVALD